mgnify:CR=1 FL=1
MKKHLIALALAAAAVGTDPKRRVMDGDIMAPSALAPNPADTRIPYAAAPLSSPPRSPTCASTRWASRFSPTS